MVLINLIFQQKTEDIKGKIKLLIVDGNNIKDMLFNIYKKAKVNKLINLVKVLNIYIINKNVIMEFNTY